MRPQGPCVLEPLRAQRRVPAYSVVQVVEALSVSRDVQNPLIGRLGQFLVQVLERRPRAQVQDLGQALRGAAAAVVAQVGRFGGGVGQPFGRFGGRFGVRRHFCGLISCSAFARMISGVRC